MDVIPVGEAARRLGVSQARIRAMITAGVLDAEKIGGRWFVGLTALRRRERWGPAGGRHLQPQNAWAALELASGIPPSWISFDKARRLAQLLDDQGLLRLAPRLGSRARTQRFYGHPGTLQRLAAVPEIRLTGISAARSNGLGIVGGQAVDAYIAANALDDVITRFALEPRSDTGNVSLRAVPAELDFRADTPTPLAAVALDLAEETDPRSAEVGTQALTAIDEDRAWRRIEPG